MKVRSFAVLMVLAASAAHAADAPADAGIAAIETLGRLNGQALACSEAAVSARTKALMLKYAPRTSRYGSTFEQATQRGFTDQIKLKSCPAATDLAQRVEVVAAELSSKLPAVE
jgi:hypothetical protein